jgi:1-acyl-sn-glycerol-3-phosphate acyltransferase
MLLRRLYSTLFWAFLVVTSALLFPVAVLVRAVTAPFDRRRRALHLLTCWWASLYTWVNPLWPVTVEGRERIRPDETYMMVANHLSFLDILVLFRLFRHFTWVSKASNFSVPLIGWNMRLNGYIPLRRGDGASVRAMMAAAEEALRGGSSVMMFPEGTRSRTGALQPFKPGAFELALRAGVPILPIVIAGTRDALPKRGFLLRGRHPITLTVLEPIPPADVAHLDAAALAAHVRRVIAAHQDGAARPVEPRDAAGEGPAPGLSAPGSRPAVVVGSGTGELPSRAEVHELYLRAFGPPPLCEGPREAALFADLYEAITAGGEAVTAVHRSGTGELAGLCYAAPWRWADHRDGWAEDLRRRLPPPAAEFIESALAVYLLAVDPAHQGRGVGSALMEAVLDAAQADRAWLATTDVASPAMRLYRASGWRRLGPGPDAPDGRPAAVLGLERSGPRPTGAAEPAG